MSVLQSVVIYDLIANLPAAGMPGRLFLASDTGQMYRDNGSSWNQLQPGKPALEVALSPGASGDFTVAHALATIPSVVFIQMTSDNSIWFQSPTRYDNANLYLHASGAATGYAEIYK